MDAHSRSEQRLREIHNKECFGKVEHTLPSKGHAMFIIYCLKRVKIWQGKLQAKSSRSIQALEKRKQFEWRTVREAYQGGILFYFILFFVGEVGSN